MLNAAPFYESTRSAMTPADESQRNIANMRYANYTLTDYSFPADSLDFATSQTTMIPNSIVRGQGVGPDQVQTENALIMSSLEERTLDQLRAQQRMYRTIPYLGRGSGNVDVESVLMQGEGTRGPRSVSTVTEQSFERYRSMPMYESMKESMREPAVEEYAVKGWVRGGADTRI